MEINKVIIIKIITMAITTKVIIKIMALTKTEMVLKLIMVVKTEMVIQEIEVMFNILIQLLEEHKHVIQVHQQMKLFLQQEKVQ